MNSKIVITAILFLSQLVFAIAPEKLDNSFEAQYQLASNKSLPMSTRWKALLSATDLANAEQIKKVMAFTKDDEWYMRNAVLSALDKIESDMVYDKAKELISDKALVVRSASVEILSRLNDVTIRKLFSEEMNKKYNFNGKSSLWVRAQMMKYLSEKPLVEEKNYFAQFLSDSDPQVTEYSIDALEKITQVRFAGENRASIASQWKKYAKDNKW